MFEKRAVLAARWLSGQAYILVMQRSWPPWRMPSSLGSYLKEDGDWRRAVDLERVRAVRAAVNRGTV